MQVSTASTPSDYGSQLPVEVPVAASYVSDAVSFAIALHGSLCVNMEGFEQELASPPHWSHPAVPFISAPVDPMDLVPALRGGVIKSRLLATFLAFGLCVASFVGGATAYLQYQPLQVHSASAEVWSIVGISMSGVVIQNGGRLVLVPAGDRLPNGERVISVMPGRGAALLESGVFVLHEKGSKNVQ